MEELDTTSWSQLYNARKKIRLKFRSIWKIPIVKKILHILIKIVKDNYSILDVGLCNRNLINELKKHFKNLNCKSMDIDRKNYHDYYSLDDIEEKFDIITMFECIEHLTLEEGAKTLAQLNKILKPNGLLLISTPNTYHPNRYWECTHKVPFRYDELGGFIELAGFKTVNIYRIYNDSFIMRLIRLYITSFIHQYFNVDFAKSIILIAKKI